MAETESFPHCELRPPLRKPIADAVEETAVRLNVVLMEAKVRLLDACRAGIVRGYWCGHYSGQSPVFARQEWEGADIDLSCGTVILANGERRAQVGLNRSDYEPWLASIAAPTPAELPPKGRRYVGDDELVAEGVDGLRTGKWSNAWQSAQALAPERKGMALSHRGRIGSTKKSGPRFRELAPETSRNIPNDGSSSRRKWVWASTTEVPMSLDETLANFDKLPDDAIVLDQVAAKIFGVSIWTLRRSNPVPARQISERAAVAASAIFAPKCAALNQKPPNPEKPRAARRMRGPGFKANQ